MRHLTAIGMIVAASAATTLGGQTRAAAATSDSPEVSMSSTWTVQHAGATASGTTSYSGTFLVDLKFTSCGTVRSGSGCVSAWTGVGIFPGTTTYRRVATSCDGASVSFTTSGTLVKSNASTFGYLKLCPGTEQIACGEPVSIA